VCPSIPGYGFSSKPKTKGFDQKAAADLFEALMLRLGYNLYMLQGGDWGSVVTSLMADSPNAPARVIGLHLNMVPIAAPFRKGVGGLLSTLASFVLPWWFYSAEERAGLLRMPLYTIKETGYFHEQSTRPQTLSYGLADSPVALLSWVVEKFYAWGDVDTDARRGGEDGADGGDTAAEILYGRFSRDELLTNIMLYWLPNKGGSSVRFYYEMWNGPGAVFDRLSALDVKVPTAVAAFPKEITTPVQYWASWFYNIKRWTLMPKGGHFAMLEEPEALVQDVQAFAVQITAGATMASDAWAESGNGNQHREL
jgi:pimeloyl-ACP methyl ester carboxylesterase